MVLGLMDFLLGGKKKTKVPKTAQVATPVANNAPATQPQAQQPQTAAAAPAQNVPDGVNNPTQNTENLNIVDSNNQNAEQIAQNKATNPTATGGDNQAQAANPTNTQQKTPTGDAKPATGGAPQKKSVSEAINKIHSELKDSGEKITNLVTDFKKLENDVSTMGHRVDQLEEDGKATKDKISEIDENMTKFLSLYELINNQYNPFVDKDSMPQKVENMIKVEGDGASVSEAGDGGEGSSFDQSELEALRGEGKSPIDVKNAKNIDSIDSVLLELDTLNIEEAAGDAVPLTELKNNTNSLVIILSWLEYLIKKVGIDEARNSLRYYTEVLRWITPEVYFELDKYLRGMKDVQVDEGATLGVHDHIVSLYFISKLNEKSLDEKLTNAVLQIIKK